AVNGLSMGAATTFVLLASATIISAISKHIPKKVRIPSFIIIIASFVTLIDLTFAAYLPEIHKVLGIYLPLIVVNCIILGRMEAYASRNPLPDSLVDAAGMGLGFALTLSLIGGVREFFGAGTLLGFEFGFIGSPAIGMILPVGAFLTLGFMLAAMNKISRPAMVSCGGASK
ncbi:MAG: electron transport complex subunit RsxE, partial [Candidatus Altiarchaeales archaeon]|nr:electron transport complex subunit RsxE [Candidatus Altiarchaeales archaeon]